MVVFLDNAGFHHFVVKVVPFAGTLAHTAEYGHAAVALSDVVDQLHDRHGLAHAGTAEQTDFTALGIGAEKVDNFNTCAKLLGLCCLIGESGRIAVNFPVLLGFDGRTFVNYVAAHIHDTAQRFRTNGNGNRRAGVIHIRAADHTVGHVHRNRAHSVFTKVLRHFQNQLLTVIVGLQRIQDRGHFAFLKLNVDNRAQHLQDFTFCSVL